ncbi:unnamed protein product [Zymoseptoria tritici ST99CH_1A5]|uniref:Uncharacterized protein n=2 Tax=Zymoseptoria tritici TaxID=1047171 RepID=A0A1Y6L7Z1_ZYMTR|nr:unnamed protein product [Zymoseptoria tritici ST99CH_1A5]
MPSHLSNSPFISLRPDHECGRSKSQAPTPPTRSFDTLSGAASPNGNGNGYNSSGHGSLNSTPYTNGHSNGYNASTQDDEFLRLDAPQQDLLLLHGPRQKYKLEKSKEIPDLQGEREILVQVLAIGLNPVDWKGADYGFSQPSYPWVNGRDFAGIVVRAPRTNSRIQQGDVVFGPSTDYRDVRKAAYQEYVVTTDYNVTRIPQGVSVKEGAALGVAWVAATVALGISFGLDFSSISGAPRGPDLVKLVRQLRQNDVPEDIRDEIFSGIEDSERPQPGEWLAIWGANSTTGQIALQLAKLAGLKVACIADIARGGGRLTELGADFLVDKYDDKRAIEILRAVTGGKLRFGVDCNGKESATSLQEALTTNTSGLKSHLLGLTGLPKSVGRNVVHHKVPIKIFHEAPGVGEAISTWLEDLLIRHSLKLPEVEVAQGGLSGVNDALDRMRTGKIGGKRIVVAIDHENKSEAPSPSNGILPNGIGAATDVASSDLSYADSVNSDPDRIRFAYWVPNVSGGLVISKIKQNTHWDLKSNIKYAKTAERVGFEYALSQIRFMAGYGADNQHEPVTFSQALLMHTERLKLIVALLPGPWNPAVAAKQVASIDNYTDGRVCVNVVSGWFKLEFTSIGQWWLDHAERYRRSKEFIQCLKGIWTQDKFSFKGDFYQFHDYPLNPKPLNLPGRPYPEIFQGGNSDDAKENAGSVSDYYFMNGNTLEGFQAQIGDVKERAKKHNREGQVGFALNAFVICRDTEEEAIRVLQEIQGKADAEAVEGFRQQVQNAGSSTGNKSGMWANSKFEDLVQYNDGFKTKLIGTKEQIAERIVLLKSLGVSILLTAFLHYESEIEHFGKEVLPLVRELEKQGRGKDEADEVRRTGDVYKAKNFSKDLPWHTTSANLIANTSSPARSTPTTAAADTKAKAKPFVSLLPSSTSKSSPAYSSSRSTPQAVNEPHRPFSSTYRNPDCSGQCTSLSAGKNAANNEPHRPFSSTYRNPDTSGQHMSLSAGKTAANEPHRPFPTSYRNPDTSGGQHLSHSAEKESANEPHRPFAAEYRNPGGEAIFPPQAQATSALGTTKQSSAGLVPGPDGGEDEEGNTPHRAFAVTHRNADIVEQDLKGSEEVRSEAHRPFPVGYRNPEFVEKAKESTTLNGHEDASMESNEQPHRAFSTSYRNPGLSETASDTTTSGAREAAVRMSNKQPHRAFSTPFSEVAIQNQQDGLPPRPFASLFRNAESSIKGPAHTAAPESTVKEPHRPLPAEFRNPEDAAGANIVTKQKGVADFQPTWTLAAQAGNIDSRTPSITDDDVGGNVGTSANGPVSTAKNSGAAATFSPSHVLTGQAGNIDSRTPSITDQDLSASNSAAVGNAESAEKAAEPPSEGGKSGSTATVSSRTGSWDIVSDQSPKFGNGSQERKESTVNGEEPAESGAAAGIMKTTANAGEKSETNGKQQSRAEQNDGRTTREQSPGTGRKSGAERTSAGKRLDERPATREGKIGKKEKGLFRAVRDSLKRKKSRD